MPLPIAFLGPKGTYAEVAAIACQQLFNTKGYEAQLLPYSSIVQALRAVSMQQTEFAVVPVENSIEGGVSATLDTLWQLDTLQIQQALVLPIAHTLLSYARSLDTIRVIYSHPQALAQCQLWLEKFLPKADLMPTNSTTEALQHLKADATIAAVASQRASEIYSIPILAQPINDHPDNCTRFWLVSREPSKQGSHTSLAFSFPANRPGALAKALQSFAQREINLSRIESRPTKRSLGEYLFFVDLEANLQEVRVQSVLQELEDCTETLKVFGSYSILLID
jgi:prephenate dehydratase